MFVCCQNIRVSLNYSQIRVQDKSAYPSVSTRSHLLTCKSLRLGIRSEVYATTVHHRALFTGLPFGKERSLRTYRWERLALPRLVDLLCSALVGIPVFCRPPLLSSSVRVPYYGLKNKEKSSSSQGQMLNYRTMPSMADDLQIITIDHGSNRAECRADSKIRST